MKVGAKARGEVSVALHVTLHVLKKESVPLRHEGPLFAVRRLAVKQPLAFKQRLATV